MVLLRPPSHLMLLLYNLPIMQRQPFARDRQPTNQPTFLLQAVLDLYVSRAVCPSPIYCPHNTHICVLGNQARLYAEGKIATRFEERDGQAPTVLSFCRSKRHVKSAVVSSSPMPLLVPLPLPAAPWPPLCPYPPAATLGVASIPLELPIASYPPALSRASLPEASNAAITAALDAATWSSLAKTFSVVDLCESDSGMPEGGWDDAIQTDVDRLSVACPAEREDVRWILAKAVELYPNAGYSQVCRLFLSSDIL